MLAYSLFYILPVFIVSLLVVRRVIFSIFDPLVLCIYALCCSIGLMLYLHIEESFLEREILVGFLLCHFVFLAGLVAGNRTKLNLFIGRSLAIRNTALQTIMVLLLVYIGLFFAVMVVRLGLVIFQDRPDASRTTLFVGGGGIFVRIIQTGILLTAVLSTVLFAYGRLKWWVLAGVWLVAGFMMLSFGAKGALFIFYACFFYALIFAQHNLGVRVTLAKWVGAPLLIGIVLVTALGVLVIDIRSTQGLTGVAVLVEAIERLAVRMVAFGDIGYLFFANDAYLRLEKTPLDFFVYISNDFLGMLRLAEYQASPGVEIYSFVLGMPNVERRGPNMQVYFTGVLYFGLFGGVIYSFLMGLVLGVVRKMLLHSFRRTNFDMIIFILGNYILFNVPLDLSFALFFVTNALVFFLPLIGFALLLPVLFGGRSPLLIRYDAVAKASVV